MSKTHPSCPKCGVAMEPGFLRIQNPPITADAIALGGTQIAFEPGPKTSWNPFKAFIQGLRGDPGRRIYNLSEMPGHSCVICSRIVFEPK